MFAATEDKDLHFRMLHDKCHTPLKQKRYCPVCEEEVAWDDAVRAYEIEPGRFVIMSPEDFNVIPETGSRSIDILDFVHLQDIDPIYFHKTYYLSPGETGKKAYKLLSSAMKETGKIAVGKVILREKQHLVTLRVIDEVISMSMMFFPDEIRASDQVPALTEKVVVHENERTMAVQLIESLAEPFDPAKYTDTYREELLKVIEAKSQGQDLATPAEPREAKVVDLMDALRASLELVERQKKKGVS
jgi:DNA end-binding protein Ku